MRVEEFMERDITAVFMDETVEDFIRACVRQFRSGMPVIDDEMRVVGFISEMDIIHNIVPSYMEMLQSTAFIPDTNLAKKKLSNIKDKTVSEYMQKKIEVVRPNDTLLSAATLMIKHGYKMLPVVDDEGILIGIVRRSEMLGALLK